MIKQNVSVIVRTRPTSNFASKNIEIDGASSSIAINIPKPVDKKEYNNQKENWKFKFDKILHNASQEDVFDYCSKDLVGSLLEGYNSTILCYGQTGAGKSFTMIGGSSNYKYRGIIPRSISAIFQEIGSRFEQAITVRVSFVEIYNDLLFDLLSTVPTHEQTGSDITILDDSKGGVHIKGLSKYVCTNEEDALNHLFEGETNRTISEHQLNKLSSRSHCIFTVYIESKSRVESSEKIVYSKLNLVDLAGSERTKKTGSEGITLKEANYINKSLSFLEMVVISACDKAGEFVPYRQCKLTNMLKDSIGGNSKTVMVANIWPEPTHLEETISTLKFGTRMMKVTNTPVVNEHVDPDKMIKNQEKIIRELKQELAMHDTLANRGRIIYDTYTPEQQYEMQKIADQYLKGEIEDIEEITSLRQVRELFIQFRHLYRKLEKKVQDSGVTQKKIESEKVIPKEAEIPKEKERHEGKGVGETEETTAGFGIGKALKNAKPKQPVDVGGKGKKGDLEESPSEALEESKEELNEEIPGTEIKSKKEKKVEVLDRQTAFIEYKKDEGRSLEEGILSNRKDLREKSTTLKELERQINSRKSTIDKLKEQLDKKREAQQAEGEIEGDVIDEEEFAIIKSLKDHKKEYKENYDKYRSLKAEVLMIKHNIEQMKQKLILSFDEWYDQTYGPYLNMSMQGSTKQFQYEGEKREYEQKLEEEIDPDALAYIRAKEHVSTVHKAKKIERMKRTLK